MNYHPTKVKISKIFDPRLRALAQTIFRDKQLSFYDHKIAGLSKKTTGKYGYELCDMMIEYVDFLKRKLGKLALDWDYLYLMSIIAPVGMYVSVKNDSPGTQWNDRGGTYYTRHYLYEWRNMWQNEIEIYLKKYDIDSIYRERVYRGIKFSGTTLSGIEISERFDRTMVMWLAVWHTGLRR